MPLGRHNTPQHCKMPAARLIVRHAVAPQLGKGSEYLSPPDKILPTPEWVYAKLERWHHLSQVHRPGRDRVLRGGATIARRR